MGANIGVLNHWERVIYVVDNFQVEVNNGGFGQYLYNGGGAWVNELIMALLEIGAGRTAEIYGRALGEIMRKVPDVLSDILSDGLPVDDLKRGIVLDKIVDAEVEEFFNCCDREFYRHPENLEELIYRYFMENRAAFAEILG